MSTELDLEKADLLLECESVTKQFTSVLGRMITGVALNGALALVVDLRKERDEPRLAAKQQEIERAIALLNLRCA